MAGTDKLKKYKSLFSTTLSNSIGTGTSDTIGLASVTGLPTDTDVTLTFDRVDNGGAETPNKMERIKGRISGNNLTVYTRGIDGSTEQAHSAGAVVEMIWNASDLNDMVDWALVEHEQDGTHDSTFVKTTATQTLSNKTLTSPVINTPTGDVVTPTGTQTLTNKTLTSPVINTPTGDVATLTGSQTLSNKTLASPVVTGNMTIPTPANQAEFPFDASGGALSSIANTGIATPFTNSNNFGGYFMVFNVEDGDIGLFSFIGGVLDLVHAKTGHNFSLVYGTANKLNVYNSSNALAIDNRRGALRQVRVLPFRLKTSQ